MPTFNTKAQILCCMLIWILGSGFVFHCHSAFLSFIRTEHYIRNENDREF